MSEERQPIPGSREAREEGGDRVPGRDGEGGYENIAMSDSPTDPTPVSPDGVTIGSPLPGVQFQSASQPSSPTDLNANRSEPPAPPGDSEGNEDQTSEKMASVLNLTYPDNDGDDNVDGDERSLMYKRYEPIRSKDFVAEVRAYMDVEQFINQAQLLLDIPDTNLAAIIDHMLAFMVHKGNASWTVKEAKQELFTHDSVHQLRRTIQGAMRTEDSGFDYDQHWVCVMCTLPTAQTRSVSIARLKSPANLSRTLQEARFIILIVAPAKEKSTKNALETARTFATLFNDMELRARLLAAHSMESFKKYLLDHAKELASDQTPDGANRKASLIALPVQPSKSHCWFARNLREDLSRRLGFYASDIKDGLTGPGTLYKTLSTIMFLYFAILLPSIALGELNSTNTDGAIDVKKVIFSQFMGGLYFAIFGGQPMIILLTTAPLALYTKVVFTIATSMEVDFLAMYACTGLWNMFFLFIYAFSGASVIMKWSTRSTEEIFALFISIAFTVDACKGVTKQFQETYHSGCDELVANATALVGESCEREKSILYLLLVLGTVWLGLTLFHFTKTPFLNAGKRELLADFALPVSVVVLSFFGSFVFSEINLDKFHYVNKAVFVPGKLGGLTLVSVFTSMGLGFCLSLLFFMDQNISGAMVNSPENRLKKGTAYHWDLFVVGLLNGVLTFLGLPMIHGALPHSPLHVLAMADVEDRVEGGVIKQKVVFVRENRVTGIVVHVLVGLSLFMLPSPLSYIPPAVLDGLFLYLAITALNNNQMFERLTLLFTEQAQYPPNHYISRVPQRKVHFFTVLQLLQLIVLCGIGFSPMPFLKMVFPVLIFLMLPIRHKIIPFLIDRKYLNFMDSSNH